MEKELKELVEVLNRIDNKLGKIEEGLLGKINENFIKIEEAIRDTASIGRILK